MNKVGFALMIVGAGATANVLAPAIIGVLNKGELSVKKQINNSLAIVAGCIALGVFIGTVSTIQQQNELILEKLNALAEH